MMWGFPWSCPWGDHDSMFADASAADMGDGPRVRALASTGCNQYVRIAVDGVAQGPAVAVTSSDYAELVGTWIWRDISGHQIALCPQGDHNTTDVDLSAQTSTSIAQYRRRIVLSIQPSLSFYSTSSQLSSWALQGLIRSVTCAPITADPYRGLLRYVLTDSSGVRSIALYFGSTCVGAGSITGDGIVNLSGDVSGSVTVAYATAESGDLYILWPTAYAIHYRTGSAFTGADFPRTPEAMAYDDGVRDTVYWSSRVLPAGTYHVIVHQINAAGVESSGISGTTVSIAAPPGPPTSLRVVSGDASATVIAYAGDGSASGYSIYDSTSGEIIDFSEPRFSTGATGEITLSGIDSSFSGIRRIVVRSVAGPYDDGNASVLTIQYSGGMIIDPPPEPSMHTLTRISGRILRATISIPMRDDMTTCKWLLFAWDAATGTGSGAAPIASGTLSGATQIGSYATQSVSGSVTADGMYYWCIRTASADGTLSESSTCFGPLLLTESAPPDPTCEAQ